MSGSKGLSLSREMHREDASNRRVGSSFQNLSNYEIVGDASLQRDNGRSNSSGTTPGARHGNATSFFIGQIRAMNPKPCPKRAPNFSAQENKDLLRIWALEEFQWMKHNNARHFRVWEAISETMARKGHRRAAWQCRNRMYHMLSVHKSIKDSPQGPRNSRFPYYQLIDETLERTATAATAPAIVLVPQLNRFVTCNNGNKNMYNSHNNWTSLSSVTQLSQNSSRGYREANDDDIGGSMPFLEQDQGSFRATNAGSFELDQQNNFTIGDGSLPTEHEQRPVFSYEDSYMGGDRRSVARKVTPRRAWRDVKSLSGLARMRGHKRQNSSMKSGNDGKEERKREKRRQEKKIIGKAAKRPRVTSTATNAIANSLTNLLQVQREWLEMERVRVGNDGAIMLYMMQMLQAIVSPNQSHNQ